MERIVTGVVAGTGTASIVTHEDAPAQLHLPGAGHRKVPTVSTTVYPNTSPPQPTTWLELAYTPMGAKLAIIYDRTPNQLEHEYNAYAYTSGRPEHIYTHRRRESDEATLIHAFRVDILKGARVTLKHGQIRLHIPAIRREYPVMDCSSYSPILTDAYLDSVRKTVALAKEQVAA